MAVHLDFARDKVPFTAGKLSRFSSSPGVHRGFCAVCGSTMSYEGDTLPGMIHVHLGALDKPADFAPSETSFPEQKLPWLCVGAQGADA